MRRLLLIVLLVWTLPAAAAQTFKVPITIVPGSVKFQPTGDYTPITGPVPVAFPVSRQVVGSTANGSCSAGLITVTADIVDGGLEVSLNGYAAGGGCRLGGSVSFEVEIQVPEFGGTTTMVRLVPKVQMFDFIDYGTVEMDLFQDDPATSSIPEVQISDAKDNSSILWNGI